MRTNVRFFTGMESAMALKVVETAETHRTIGADVWPLLAVCQEVTLKVVAMDEHGATVCAFVLLAGIRVGRRLWACFRYFGYTTWRITR
jgi:hypothetical protein